MINPLRNADFKRGTSFATGVIAFVSGVLALLNWSITTFELPIAPFTEPLLTLYQQTIVRFIEFIDFQFSWAVPDWNPSLFSLALVWSMVCWRSHAILDPEDGFSFPFLDLIIAVAFSLLLFVPFVRYLALVMVGIFTILPLIVSTLTLVIGYRQYNAITVGYYMWGIIGATVLGLAVNQWYG